MDKFESLRIAFQQIIDCISQKDAKAAHIKLVEATNMLNEMLDLTIDDDDLIILRKYQMLLLQLNEGIALLN